MSRLWEQKSSVEQIRQRFDADVERFANVGTGQQAVIDASFMLELISETAVKVAPRARQLLDIGCGAGNSSIKIVREIPGLNCDLLDLSEPMLERANDRLQSERAGRVRLFQGDFRDLPLEESGYDIIVAAAVLHHLRDDSDWENCFRKIIRLLRPAGVLLVSDMVFHANPMAQDLMWHRYGAYLEKLGGPDYRRKVFAYIDEEDSPRDLVFQFELMRRVGFSSMDVLHKNSCFAAYMGVK